MLIDFHVHVFPDKIAEKAFGQLLRNMQDTYNIKQRLSYRGTVSALVEAMDETGVDISVIQPIATRWEQHTTINAFAQSIKSDRIISFASLHPYGENIDKALLDLKERGFCGIKLHPDYQGVYADDERFIKLIKKATEMEMYVTIHSGHDTGILPPHKGAIDKIKTMLRQVDDRFLILAHMGAFNQWDEVEESLLKTNAYFDTAVVSRFIKPEQYRRIIDKHGADKILFGSDAPWESPDDTYKFLVGTGVDGEELELICHKNAEKILGI